MRDKVIAGIDIGGTNTVFGFVAEDGEILAKSRIDTICHGTFDEYVAALCEAVDALKRLACPDCELVAGGAGAGGGRAFSLFFFLFYARPGGHCGRDGIWLCKGA